MKTHLTSFSLAVVVIGCAQSPELVEADIPDSGTEQDAGGCIEDCAWDVDSYGNFKWCELREGETCLDYIRGCRHLVGAGELGVGDMTYETTIPDLGCLETTQAAIRIVNNNTLEDATALYQLDGFKMLMIDNVNHIDRCDLIEAMSDVAAELCVSGVTGDGGCDNSWAGCINSDY